jgi:hypothetical protein
LPPQKSDAQIGDGAHRAQQQARRTLDASRLDAKLRIGTSLISAK